MAEISEVLDAYKKPLKTAELVNCVKNTMTGELICPVAIEQGMRFAIREGGRTIGAGVVSKILK